MTIEVSPETVAQLETEAQGRVQLAAFRQAINERMSLLIAGKSADGEEVMARLIAEIDEWGGARTLACSVHTRVNALRSEGRPSKFGGGK